MVRKERRDEKERDGEEKAGYDYVLGTVDVICSLSLFGHVFREKANLQKRDNEFELMVGLGSLLQTEGTDPIEQTLMTRNDALVSAQ